MYIIVDKGSLYILILSLGKMNMWKLEPCICSLYILICWLVVVYDCVEIHLVFVYYIYIETLVSFGI